MDVEQRRDACWKRIVDEQMVIPAHSFKLYNSDGNKIGRLLYRDRMVTLESTSTDSVVTSSDSVQSLDALFNEVCPVVDPVALQTEVLDAQDSDADEVSGVAGNIESNSKNSTQQSFGICSG